MFVALGALPYFLSAERIAEATANAAKAGVTEHLKLLPKPNKELRPRTRVESHVFEMGEIQPRRVLDVGGRPVYLVRQPMASGAP